MVKLAHDGSDVCDRIATHLADQLGTERFEHQLARVVRLEIDHDGTLIASARTAFHVTILERQFSAMILEAARRELDRQHVQLHWRVDPDLPEPERAANEPHPPADAACADPTSPEPVEAKHQAVVSGAARAPLRRDWLDLREFVVGHTNRLAYNAALAVAEGDTTIDSGVVFFHGPCGVGKTHLLQGIARRYQERTGSIPRYVPCEQFINEYIPSVKNGRLAEFQARYRMVELLCIDDVHLMAGKSGTQAELLQTLESLRDSGSRVVLASDGHPRQIEGFKKSLVSRWLGGMVLSVGQPDAATRRTIAGRLLDLRGLSADEAALDLIANAAVRSARELQGIVAQLDAWRRLGTEGGAGGVIDVTLVRRALGDTPVLTPRKPIRAEQIVRAVCERTGVEVSEVCGKSRHKRVVLARGLASYLIRELTSHSFPEIARTLGRGTHSTVIAACRRIEQSCAHGEHAEGCGRELESVLVSELVRELNDRLTRFSQAA